MPERVNHDLLVELSTKVSFISEQLKSIDEQLKVCTDSIQKSKVDQTAFSKDLETLRDMMKNHLEWHKEQSLRIIGYAGLSSGIISTAVAIIFKLLGI